MKEKKYNVDKNGIPVYNKPCEEAWGFDFDDTFVEEMVRESEKKLREDRMIEGDDKGV